MRILIIYLLLFGGFARADTFLIRSVDGGRTWTDIDPGPPDQFLMWFSVDPLTSALYALTANSDPRIGEQHLLVSGDGGETWQLKQTIEPIVSSWFAPVATPASPDTLYEASQQFVSNPEPVIVTRVLDGGQQTEQYPAAGLGVNTEPPPSNSFDGGTLTTFVADPSVPARLYAMVTDDAADDLYAYFQALWMSADGGRNWRRLQPPLADYCIYPSVWIGPSDSAVYLTCALAGSTGNFWKSADGGASWMPKAVIDGERPWNLSVGPGTPGVLYVVDGARTIWKSTDDAATWLPSGNVNCCASVCPSCSSSPLITVSPSNSAVLFATGNTGIWESDDSGATWTALFASDGDSDWNLHADPRAPGTLYASSATRQQARLNGTQTFLRSVSGDRPVAPGSLVSIYGQGLTGAVATAGTTPLPENLGGASVMFTGQPAPLLFVSPDQINAQAPFGLSGPVTMETHRPDGSVDRQTVTLSSRAVFILRESLSRLAAPLLFHGSDERPVTDGDPLHAGETVSLLALGMGELTPSITAGSLPPTPSPQLRDPICVGLRNFPADGRTAGGTLPWVSALWAGAQSGQIGVYRVDYQLPVALTAGTYSLLLSNCPATFDSDSLDSVNIGIQ